MDSPGDYLDRVERIAEEVLRSPNDSRATATERLLEIRSAGEQLHRIEIEIWSTTHRVRASYMRERMRVAAVGGLWIWVLCRRAALRRQEARVLSSYSVVGKRIAELLADLEKRESELRCRTSETGRSGSKRYERFG